MTIRVFLFLIINFAALGLGGFFTGDGVSSQWYADLAKAPWTPPGWVFGAAWTGIMICFSFYMAMLWSKVQSKKSLLGLFVLQWFLNTGWNPTFFYFQNITAGLFLIASLTALVGFLFFSYRHQLRTWSLLLLPYFLWLIIATSLNAYILIHN